MVKYDISHTDKPIVRKHGCLCKSSGFPYRRLSEKSSLRNVILAINVPAFVYDTMVFPVCIAHMSLFTTSRPLYLQDWTFI